MATNSRPVCISVINMKGGVGKTTIAALLGRYASRRLNRNVLMIDLDPQANLSQAFMHEKYQQFLDDKSPSIVEIFNGYLPPSSHSGSPSSLNIDDVIVGNTLLGGPNLELIPSRFDFSDNLIDSTKPQPRVLAQIIKENFQNKDVIIIDCAPTESIFTQAAYHASRYILVPVKPEYFATIGFPLLQDSLGAFQQKYRGHYIEVAGVVINNWSYHYSGNQGGPERKESIAELKREAQINGWHMFNKEIPHSRGFPKMMRGNYSHLGDAYLFNLFAEEFFVKIGIEASC